MEWVDHTRGLTQPYRYAALCAMGLALAVFVTGCSGGNNQAILDLVPLRDATLVDATGQVAYAFARTDLACSGR
jgi:hypothetical protein